MKQDAGLPQSSAFNDELKGRLMKAYGYFRNRVGALGYTCSPGS